MLKPMEQYLLEDRIKEIEPYITGRQGLNAPQGMFVILENQDAIMRGMVELMKNQQKIQELLDKNK